MNVSSIHKRDISRRLISSPLPPVSSEGTREPPRVYPPFRTHSWYISIAARFLRRGFQGPPVALPPNGSHGKRRSRLVRTEFFPLPTEPFPRHVCTLHAKYILPLLSTASSKAPFVRGPRNLELSPNEDVRACVCCGCLPTLYIRSQAREV